ncbi:MAG: iron-sulfur cluster assembly scaffold protein [Oligoflexia bacterium]|nr:iron-sulfur cluster assembly scaffold protein [Oligoflexia bacterium]
MAWQYSEKTKKLFMDAVKGAPGTHLGEIEDADGIGEHGSIACGDAIKFTFRVKKDPHDPLKDTIIQAKYLTFGCTSAIASSEALCMLIEQRQFTPVQALQISNQDIVDFLGGLPQQKIHCSVMGAEALEAAVIYWAKKRSVNLKSVGIEVERLHEVIDEGRMVCQCFSLTDTYLKRKIKELNLRTLEQVTNALKAGGACTACQMKPGGIQDILQETWGEEVGVNNNHDFDEEKQSMCNQKNEFDEKTKSEGGNATEGLSPYQMGKKVEQVINDQIRPLLHRDGGDIEVVDIKDNMVYCQLKGACNGCMGAQMTLKMMVERILREQVDSHIKVVAV